MKILLRFLGFLFAAGTIVFIVGIGAIAGVLWHFSKDLPDYSQLKDYEPPVMTRVHAADGSLLAEYAKERRLYLPIQAVPKLVIHAFLAAEDKNFYEHAGLDFSGLGRAVVFYVQNYGSSRRPQGASTITQQVAKNFLLPTRCRSRARSRKRCSRCASSAPIRRTRSSSFISTKSISASAPMASPRRRFVFRQVGARIVDRAGRLSRRLAQGAEQLQPVPPPRGGDRAPQWVIDRMVEDGFIPAAEARRRRRVA